MDSILDHNQSLQEKGLFSVVDLEENKQGRYTPAQIEQEKMARDSRQKYAEKFDNKKPIIILIFGVAFIMFCAILYFVGVFGTLQNILGGFFLPAMLGALILAALMIFVVVPRQYQSSVEMARGATLIEKPMGAIQTFEGRAEVSKSQRGINRQGRQSSNVSYILQVNEIQFRLAVSFWEIIQPDRMYRVCAVNNDGWWRLLSIETLE